MATERLSLRIDAGLKKSLEQEARREDRSASYLAVKAIEAMLRNRVKSVPRSVMPSQRPVRESSSRRARWTTGLPPGIPTRNSRHQSLIFESAI